MNGQGVRRVYVEKKPGCDVEARNLYQDLKTNLGIHTLRDLRIINRYDVEGITDEIYQQARNTIFSEPPVDYIYDEILPVDKEDRVIAMEYLPGQYDQRADSAAQCIQILACGRRPEVRVAKLIVLKGNLTNAQYEIIKNYCINPVEAREASLEKPVSLEPDIALAGDVKILEGFISASQQELIQIIDEMGLAMNVEDMEFCQAYFRDHERRDPTVTEIRVIDTYWSDHCRHTTFLTNIEEVEMEEGPYTAPLREAYHHYLKARSYVYEDKEKPVCLMDIATIAMKKLKKDGKLQDLDESDEINACSIVVPVDVDGQMQEWLVMFKNETHNHPTEIEPFGGAATCLGGAVRDPLSGRSYVYQAMRVTGSGDPRTRVEDTLPGKLPQRKITTGAAAGYSSYGNQVGISTGLVSEIYNEGFVAKRMELGAVIAAAPRKNVVRQKPEAGDVVILLGGRTGRDGCGGATGSSKAHTQESLLTSGAEVQKGNPLIERNIQRLFRKPAVAAMIKKCNDFGAGGVSVAIGELASGLIINLDAVPQKYEGLDGTELAISESQERMAVVISKEHSQAFIQAAVVENLEATEVAVVTQEKRLRMTWRGREIVDISRAFLDTNGTPRKTKVYVKAPCRTEFFDVPTVEADIADRGLKESWFAVLQDLNQCSQKGLVEMFDSTIGAATVLMPYGGKYQLTPSESMVAKIPVLNGETNTGTIMSFGYSPAIFTWSPFHGAVYAIVEAVSKVVAAGGNHRTIRLTLQEYFERLGQDPEKWGKPFSALLGAYYAQMKLGIPSIGGKDSMSGTFHDLNVPPTVTAFAVNTVKVENVISPEFKQTNSTVILIPCILDDNKLPDFAKLHSSYDKVHQLITQGKVLAAHTVGGAGWAPVISKMSFGNRIGFVLNDEVDESELFVPGFGSLILEISSENNPSELLGSIQYRILGKTHEKDVLCIKGIEITLDEALEKWQEPLESIFPTKAGVIEGNPKKYSTPSAVHYKSNLRVARPRVFMPVFPGTNCEYDTQRAFEKAGALVDLLVFRNLSPEDIDESLTHMVNKIQNAQIIMLPGGLSAGDEPDGSGKFIATIFRNPQVRDAVMELLKKRDGLMLGISNGFQALIKLGLLPYGEIRDIDEHCPTLTFNTIGRHVSCIVQTRIASTRSPWLSNVKVGDVHTLAVSHGEGRFIADAETIDSLARNGQIAAQYVDPNGIPTYDIRYNPNGSMDAIEGIISPDGRILGKMGHSERIGLHVAKNIPGEKDQGIFEAGVRYYK